MICTHISITHATIGAEGTCSNCTLPIIHNGIRWVWTQELSPTEQRNLRQTYTVNRLTKKTAPAKRSTP